MPLKIISDKQRYEVLIVRRSKCFMKTEVKIVGIPGYENLYTVDSQPDIARSIVC
jgi:hypothetical protein